MPRPRVHRPVVVLTARRVEYEAVRRHLKHLRSDAHPHGTFQLRWTIAAPEAEARYRLEWDW